MVMNIAVHCAHQPAGTGFSVISFTVKLCPENGMRGKRAGSNPVCPDIYSRIRQFEQPINHILKIFLKYIPQCFIRKEYTVQKIVLILNQPAVTIRSCIKNLRVRPMSRTILQRIQYRILTAPAVCDFLWRTPHFAGKFIPSVIQQQRTVYQYCFLRNTREITGKYLIRKKRCSKAPC